MNNKCTEINNTKRELKGWVKEEGGLRFYLEPGHWVTDDWYQDEGKRYWFNNAGYAVREVWYFYKENWYYFGTDYAMVKGVQVIEGKAYVFDENGAMVKEGTALRGTVGEKGVLMLEGIPQGETPGSGPKLAADLTAVGAEQKAQKESGEKQPVSDGAQTAGPTSISDRGIALIKEFEGCRLTAYLCAAGIPTIGYGHTAGVVMGTSIDQAQAEELLRKDLRKFEQGVLGCLSHPVTQSQFDALVSFAYNLGVGALKKSTLIKLLNAGQTQAAAGEFLKWNRAGGRVLNGLTRRRQREKELFLS